MFKRNFLDVIRFCVSLLALIILSFTLMGMGYVRVAIPLQIVALIAVIADLIIFQFSDWE